MKKHIAVIIFISMLTGCQTIKRWFFPIEPHQIIVKVTTKKNINPNLKGKPCPVVLQLYQLSGSDAFSISDYINIYKDQQGTLKQDLLSESVLGIVYPGKTIEKTFDLKDDANYVGIIANFSDFADANSKVLFKLKVEGQSILALDIDGVNLSSKRSDKNE